MANYVMGYWDCQYCGQKGNPGDKRECEGCGHPRDESVTFYMKDATHISSEKAATISKNPDWYCSFCNTLNSDFDTRCKGCSASREESEENYFTLKKKNASDAAFKKMAANFGGSSDDDEDYEEEYPPKKCSVKRPGLWLALGAIALFLLIFAFIPKKKTYNVTDFSWDRRIDIEDYVEVSESDWSLPAGGELVRTASEIHHYNQVLDHYEDVEVQKSREVQDGYDTWYEDMGNGYFEEHSTPRYRTEYYYETETQPVYRDEPVYATKYYYKIWKWKVTRNVSTSGEDHSPYWGETNFTGQEREFSKDEYYYFHVKDAKGNLKFFEADYSFWNTLSEGDSLTIKSNAGATATVIDSDGNEIATLHKH